MLTNIPVWASVLLFVLLSLGILQSRPRDVSAGRVSGIALAMCGVSLYGVVSAFGAAAASLLPWLLGLAGAAFMIMPAVTGTGWQRVRQLRRLRAQVTLAATEPLPGLAYRFESVSRDLFLQVVTHTKDGSAESRDLLAWGLAVQESGRAVLELRQQLAAGDLPPVIGDAAQAALQAVALLYQQPDGARWREAEHKVLEAIAASAGNQTVHLHLYQLLGALRDDESPLAGYIPQAESTNAA